MSEKTKAALRLSEKSKVQRLKQDFLGTIDFETLERVAVHCGVSEPICEKCGRIYCDHENKY